MYNVYPNETVAFIQKNIHQLTPISWVAASEKLPTKIKAPLLVKRKKFRQKTSIWKIGLDTRLAFCKHFKALTTFNRNENQVMFTKC